MDSFNFYINIDQCLNMSNYDMFFYKLQHDRKFFLSNVQLSDEKGHISYPTGEKSIKKAFYEIRSYIDKTPFLIRKYRMVFGIRQARRENPTWRQSVLYKLLWFYYGLADNKLFIKSRESVNKNVSVIVLYDTDMVLDMPPLNPVYECADDILILAKTLGMERSDKLTQMDCLKTFKRYLDLLNDEEEKKKLPKEISDPITKRFISDYVGRYEKSFTEYNLNYESRGGLPPTIEEVDRINNVSDNVFMSRILHSVIEFTEDLIGHYCVFQKEIDQNSLSDRLLAFLSIVDYITSDLKPPRNATNSALENLKQSSQRVWEESMNDSSIQERYGQMIDRYQKTLNNALREMQPGRPALRTEKNIIEFEKPEEITVTGPSSLKPKKEYEGTFDELIKKFAKVCTSRKTALDDWDSTYYKIKEGIKEMELDLERYARDISIQYNEQLNERQIREPRVQWVDLCSPEELDGEIREEKREQKNILEQLKESKMNPSLKFADQLNLDRSLESCNKGVVFFLKCQKMIVFINFLLTIFCGGGIILLHHGLLQTYLFNDGVMFSAFLVYFLLTFVFYLFCYHAPAAYFRRKILTFLDQLSADMAVYIKGYFDKAEDFRKYINLLNELDARNRYIEGLEEVQKKEQLRAKKYLWHKTQIIDHLRKSSFFENLVHTLSFNQLADEASCVCELNIDLDVIHNELYWVQRRSKEESK